MKYMTQLQLLLLTFVTLLAIPLNSSEFISDFSNEEQSKVYLNHEQILITDNKIFVEVISACNETEHVEVEGIYTDEFGIYAFMNTRVYTRNCSIHTQKCNMCFGCRYPGYCPYKCPRPGKCQ